MTLQHQYFRGEHSEDGWKVDGFAIVNGRKIFWEFLGCYYHQACPKCHPYETDERWERKKAFLETQGTLITMFECEWSTINKGLRWKSEAFPYIQNNYGKEDQNI